MILGRGRLRSQSPRKPRASGDDPGALPDVQVVSSVNPARAGMILLEEIKKGNDNGKPRASGDDPRRYRVRRQPEL